jgi:hypothetical protein
VLLEYLSVHDANISTTAQVIQAHCWSTQTIYTAAMAQTPYQQQHTATAAAVQGQHQQWQPPFAHAKRQLPAVLLVVALARSA